MQATDFFFNVIEVAREGLEFENGQLGTMGA
jgi:hypothetical protein